MAMSPLSSLKICMLLITILSGTGSVWSGSRASFINFNIVSLSILWPLRNLTPNGLPWELFSPTLLLLVWWGRLVSPTMSNLPSVNLPGSWFEILGARCYTIWVTLKYWTEHQGSHFKNVVSLLILPSHSNITPKWFIGALSPPSLSLLVQWGQLVSSVMSDYLP